MCGSLRQQMGQARRLRRDDSRDRGFPSVCPTGGGGLRVEVEHGGTQAVLFCSDGEVNRDGRLAGATFLANDGDYFHGCVFAPQYVVVFMSIHKNMQTCKQ